MIKGLTLKGVYTNKLGYEVHSMEDMTRGIPTRKVRV